MNNYAETELREGTLFSKKYNDYYSSKKDALSESTYVFLEKNNLKIEDINHLIFHPGGKKIVETVEGLFKSLGKNIDDTKEVLRLYGNMSSATVLYCLLYTSPSPRDGW